MYANKVNNGRKTSMRLAVAVAAVQSTKMDLNAIADQELVSSWRQ